MPTNRRRGRRYLRPATSDRSQAAAWNCAFETGWDYFADLAELGHAGQFDLSRGFRKAAEEAWRRLGDLHMQTRETGTFNRPAPWALEQFGEP